MRSPSEPHLTSKLISPPSNLHIYLPNPDGEPLLAPAGLFLKGLCKGGKAPAVVGAQKYPIGKNRYFYGVFVYRYLFWGSEGYKLRKRVYLRWHCLTK